jgi:hypothetical protein
MANSTLTTARVITNCPLCGFRQRVDRLTGPEFQVTGMEHDLLPLEAQLAYADKGRKGLRAVKQPVLLPEGMEQEMLYALAAKILPLVRYLHVKVPGFRESTTEILEVVILDQGVKRDVERQTILDVPVKFGSEVDKSWLNVKREWSVPQASQKNLLKNANGIAYSKRESRPSRRTAVESQTKFDQPVPMEFTVSRQESKKRRRESG